MGKEVLVFWPLGRGEIVLEISVLEMVLFRRSFDVSPSAALQGNTVVMYDVSSTEVSDWVRNVLIDLVNSWELLLR